MNLPTRSLASLALAATLLSPLVLASGPAVQDWSGHGLSVSLEALGEFAVAGGQSEFREGNWMGTVEGSTVALELYVIPRAKFDLNEPSDLVDLTENSRANYDRRQKRPPFAFETTGPRPGAYGFISFAWVGFARKREGTKTVGETWCLGGILPEHGYTIEIEANPPLNDAGKERLERFFAEGIKYSGPVGDPRWTDEELKARWQRQAPDKVLEDSKLLIVRTKHYVILTNLKKGTARGFGKKIDLAYEAIREIYPFEDIEGQRLLPIFYFVTSDQYFKWCVKNLGWTMEAARRSGGVASGDVYCTYHQATNAPVHIHEATHQVFKNRLRLGGGGSWFQEGVAEYMSSAPNDLGAMKGIAKRKKHVALRTFVTIESMLYSADPNGKGGGSTSGGNYMQAACVVEFVRHGKYKDKFQEYIHAMGRVPRSDLDAIEKELRRLFGRDVDGFNDDFQEYWSKRKKPRQK
jgi:hypothetical protein